MKTQLKRFSKSTISVLLAVCLLFSCMTVGIIATSAAQDYSESLGASVSGTPLYYDFTQLTSGGYNYIDSNGDWQYGTDRSQVIAGGWPTDGNTTIAKWEQGGWDGINVKASDVESGKNMLVAHADNTVTWDVYGGSGGESGGGESSGGRILFVGVPTSWNNPATTPNTVIHTYNPGSNGTDRTLTYTGLKSSDNNNYIYYTEEFTTDQTAFGARRSDNGWYADDSKSIDDYNILYIWYDNGSKTSYTTYQMTSTASLSASSTNITTAQTSTLTPSLATNSEFNDIKSTSYSVTRNSGSGTGSVTNGVFSATGAGTYTVTATVTYNAKGYTDITKTATATKQITVTAASNPTCSAVSLSQSPSNGSIYKDVTSVTYTATATSPVSGVTYNFKVDGTSKQNTSSNTYTTTYDSTGSKSVTVSVEKSSFDTVTSSAVSTTVDSLPTVYFNWNGDGSDHNPTMTYDATASASKSNHIVYKLDQTWPGNSSRYIKIYDGSDRFKTSGAANITDNKPLSGSGVSTSTTDNGWIVVKTNTGMTSSENGKYTFYWDFTDKKLYVEYPHKVTFNTDGGSSVASQIVNYNGKATRPSSDPTKTGYTFVNWVTESGGSTAFNFTGTSITTNKTIYASWDQDTYDITYPSTTTGYTLAGTQPSSAHYGDTVSFTVTPSSGYRLDYVKYTPSGGTATACTAGSNNEYHFTMPDKAVTVTVGVVRQYTVTLTAGTGFATLNSKVGSASATSYTSGTTLTVDSGTNVVFTVTYTDGYEYDSSNSTLGTAVASNSNKTFTITSIAANATVTIAAKKTEYTVSTAAAGSTNGSSYSDNLTSSASITTTGITSGKATKVDGFTATAPATVTYGGATYNFAQWSTTNCQVKSGSALTNRSASFTPTANGAVATAQYKKVYNITIGSNEAGEGSGTVTCSAATVVAGGSYTITLTPDSYSVVDTLKINGTGVSLTAGSGNVKTYTGTATANVTAVGRFTTNVLLGNKKLDGDSNWTEPAMTSNGDGTYSMLFSNLAAASGYTFKVRDNGTYKDYTTDTAFDNGGTSATLTSVNDGGINYSLTLTEISNVTIVYSSTSGKITNVNIDPADSTTYAITVGSPSDATLTATYRGTTYNEGDTINARAGQQITFSATTAESKYVSGYTLGGTAVTSPYTVTASDNGKTLTCTVANKLKVTCTTNKTAWGTVEVDKEYAAPGETVTISKKVSSGTLTKITVYNGSTVVKEWTRNSSGDLVVTTPQAAQSSANQVTQVGLTGLAGSIYSFINKAGEALGASDDSTAVGADDPLTFTMPNGAVTVSAEYEEYVGTSTWLYNGYDTSGNAKSGYYQQPMAEGSVGGSKYAYYNVTGRGSENYDQLFTVSDTSAATTGYLYFTRPKDWGAGWSSSNNPHAYFWNSSGQVGNNWPGSGMSWYDNNTYGEGLYKIAIPAGATKVKINDNTSTCYRTVEIDLTTTSGAYYLSGGGSGTDADGYHVSEWPDPPSDAGISTGVEYYKNSSGINFSDHWYTGGFGDSNANSHQFARPSGTSNGKDLASCKDDYYIVVLYPNTSYTFNNNTESTGSDPVVLWMSTLPGQTETVSSTVKVYAKDGTIRRDNDQPERNDKTYSTFEQHANTFVYSDSGYATHIGTRSSNDKQTSEGSTGYNGYTYDYIAKFEKGETLYIKTNLDSTLKEKYYLAAYCINGKTYELHAASESDDGVVTESFTVPEDWEDKYVEITPIYFLRDTEQTNTITFYIEGYDETVMNAGWGNTPFVYPFYQDANFNYVSNINNAFGGYPGQPMVFYKGNYYIQLPKEITTTISTGQTGTATIKGVTLGNGYWDDIHYHIGEVKSHFQTYDYDDLYKIYNEKGNADRIICAFKYRTKKNNDEPPAPVTYSNYNSTNGNGWEVLTNYYGQPVDVFGNVLTEGSAEYNLAMSIINGSVSADSAAVVHAISQDYKSNSAGDYATEWVIYNTSGTKVVASSGGKTSIVPSALAINANTSGTGELTDNFDKYDNATKAFKSIYTALYNDSNVLNKPAVVTYEKSIYGGGDKADRCDARWYFSQKNAPITATTRIEYTDDGRTWNTDTYTSGTGTGSSTGTKAYFTGRASTATDIPDDTSDVSGTNTTTLGGHTGDGYYTFKAENAGQYQFVGWYLLRDNYQNISTRSSYAADAPNFPSHAEMTKNGDIFVARFKKTATGTFDIYHEVHPQTSGYGTVDVSAVVKNGDTVLHTYSSTGPGTSSHIQIGSEYIQSGAGNTIVATFTASPYPTSNFDNFYATIQDLLEGYQDYSFIDSISISSNTATVTYNVDKLFSFSSGSPVQTVTNVTHYSKFSLKTNLTYSLEYTFNTRYYGTKLYKYPDVKFTEQELRSYFLDQITDPECDHIKLDKQFVKAKAPFESNYREDLTWVVDNVTFNAAQTTGYLTATQVSKKWSTATVYDFTNAGNMETATMVAPYEKLFKQSVTTKPTYASDEEEATAINDWSVSNDQMYHPIRTSYVPEGETDPVALYIHHWDIYQLDSFTYKTVNNSPKMADDGYNLDVDLSKSKIVAQAYSSRFNYVGYDDYAIVPVYTTDAITSADRQSYSDNRTDSSATLLTITRNQWNAAAAGSTGKAADDRIYIDFMLNFNYSVTVNNKKTNILLNSTGDNIVAGFVVRSYTWDNEQKQYGSKSQVIVLDKAQINDKNRMEYCFGIQNTENNRRSGLYYEFKPFIIDKNTTGAGSSITLPNSGGTYNALYADSNFTVLDHVSFYQLGRL